MTRIACRCEGQHGFTMLELLAVLVMIAIVGTVVITSRYNIRPEIMLVAEAEALRSHLQYAQTRAMNTDCDFRWEIRFTPLTSRQWQVFTNAPGITPRLPGEYPDPNTPASLDIHRMESDVNFVSAPDSIFFNCWGEPVDTLRVRLTTDQDVVLGASGSPQQIRVRVLAQTGRLVTL